ncbi:hypothetical protein FYJ89_00330 [Corynebacterium urealyticum]|uniref:Uncharacterized protein n=3 Tax=Corynebacteriaceae TaxID=1653 RepID=A0A5D4FPR6_9CORY|nr:hypothetical protein FYJ89_00330 [Corynebacterium urealyticum]TYR18471.1 hypothetical protein FYJ88_06700 [Corynebacterium urealyticum]TYR20198.1 hypothetical protein FYJ87_04290 [Corynebacterium urealyticum]
MAGLNYSTMQHPQPTPGSAPTPGSHMPAKAGGPTPNSPEAQADHLAENIDELLSQRLEGTEEAEMLEQAHSLISKALGQG